MDQTPHVGHKCFQVHQLSESPCQPEGAARIRSKPRTISLLSNALCLSAWIWWWLLNYLSFRDLFISTWSVKQERFQRTHLSAEHCVLYFTQSRIKTPWPSRAGFSCIFSCESFFLQTKMVSGPAVTVSVSLAPIPTKMSRQVSETMLKNMRWKQSNLGFLRITFSLVGVNLFVLWS